MIRSKIHHHLVSALGVLALAVHAAPAYAYLNPGTGSILIQGAIAAIAAGLFTMRLYWDKLKAYFSGKKSEKAQPAESTSADKPEE